MKIPEKYIHQSGSHKGKLNHDSLQVTGTFVKGDPHPKCSSIVFKQYTKHTGVITQRWETIEVSNSALAKRRFCNMTLEEQNHIREGRRRWRLENINRVKTLKRESHLRHRLKNSTRAFEWNKKNPKRRAEITKRNREKYKDDPEYIVKRSLRGHMRNIKPGFKHAPTEKMLDCSIERCCKHLESQFTEGMSWDNYGEWHIDHIIPCAFFDLTKPSHQKVCFNWQNLQPLWESDNCVKGDKIPWYVLLTIVMNNYKTITL